MSKKKQRTVGFAFTGSFCTYEKIKEVVRQLVKEDNRVIPIFSQTAQTVNCRFGDARDFIIEILEIPRSPVISCIARFYYRNTGNYGRTWDFFNSGGGTDWSERTFGYSCDCAMYRKYDGKTCSGDYRYTGIDGGKSAYAE